MASTKPCSGNLSGLNPANFQTELNGKSIQLYTLRNKNGVEMNVTNYGGFVPSILVPDRDGNLVDVVLGHETIENYYNSPEKYLGAAIGRYGNRIAKGTFNLDGNTYHIPTDNPACALHGGAFGYHLAVWDAEQIDEQTLLLSYVSPDGESGFPGTLTIQMEYKWRDDNAFEINYKATTDKATVVNLTHHSYFNLNGAGKEQVTNHNISIQADYYTPMDSNSVPTGEIAKVENTPMDFRQPHNVGARIDDDFDQLVYGKGYDHNYVLNKNFAGELSLAATAHSPLTGITMEVYTTEPGVQLYTANWLNGFKGKNGLAYPERTAFCFETQHFPASPNFAHFPTTTLRPDELYTHTCIYKFGVEK